MKIRIICTAFLLSYLAAAAPVQADTTKEPVSPEELCLPGVYLDTEPSCAVLGPSAYFTERAMIQAEIATQNQRFVHIDSSYGPNQYEYLQVHEEKVKVYDSLDDAVERTGSADELPEGYTFISYVDVVNVDGKNFYQLPDGRWLRNGYVEGLATPNRFLGVQPTSPPTRKFGWTVTSFQSQMEPGYGGRRTGIEYDRYHFVEVFDEVKIGESYWYLIGPDEWVHMTMLALVYPAEGPPEGVWADRWIEINLHEQTISAYDNGQMVFATLITTGSNKNYTRPGIFQIYEKLPVTHMAGSQGEDDAYFLMDIPWTMYFDQARAFHAEYWHDHLGYRSSHGCVNLSFPDANWLYEFAGLGDWVYVWDPSGHTPVNEDLFDPEG
jgi:hypothetical protein